MKVLYLGPRSTITQFLINKGENVTQLEHNNISYINDLSTYDFLISYGYRYIIGKTVIDLFPERAINLHISYLPWNRGADPNIWSFVNQTPKGVTIHLLDRGIDSGDILFQKEVEFTDKDTLASSYQKLKTEIEHLFMSKWEKLKAGDFSRTPQIAKGSFHLSQDKGLLNLPDGWNTLITDLPIIPIQ